MSNAKDTSNVHGALMERATVTVDEAAAALGVHRNSAYEAVRNGELPSIKIGKRIAVPTAPLRRMLGMEAAVTGLS